MFFWALKGNFLYRIKRKMFELTTLKTEAMQTATQTASSFIHPKTKFKLKANADISKVNVKCCPLVAVKVAEAKSSVKSRSCNSRTDHKRQIE